ncbi:hypothetical protein [Aeromicrobium sp. Sec7.5]|uniref:hypothetical protein n=1 Tax=Aeromicrobium sp. Sec7.5 TaxID=3121276 RepID=UPI002FE4ED78
MIWVIVSVVVATATVVGVLATVFTLSTSRRARPELGPRPPPGPLPSTEGAPAPPPRPGAVDGTWNAMIAGGGLFGAMGGTVNATFGRMDVVSGVLSFTRDGATGPDWSTPCTLLRVRQLGALVAKGDVELNGPMGQVRCTVSREHVNRFTQNGFKDMREQGYAREFVHAALSHGAVYG